MSNILVTGGSRGLGKAMVKTLAAQANNHVFFTYAQSADLAKELTDELKNTTALHCNFANPSTVDELVAQVPNLDLDVLINNAFIGFEKEYSHKLNPDDYVARFELNVLPTLKITQAAITSFRKKKYGKIINILSSFIINKPPIGMSDYVAEKNYILSLSKSWATENIRFNITSNCVSPSMMKTDFTNLVDERIIEQMIQTHPLKKLLTVEETADTIAFLCQCSQHINGTNLLINAGEDLI